ncbi:MAG: Two-component transcriptional response regulator, LuxR family [uncultured Frankineae bacterium]|uniref:Two-component transcriptional response regulator, LuxR family n=1 Tax=uncultured Frankineae bacterium TaxID=437475 RepID=A0A6J4MFN3_9ACTN|nr:MAG: Two-component transcriptional response regulator, LuxR family [uncultured Frankineae bacterium]
MTIRVLLIDDHDLIRGGLRGAFERDGAFEVVDEAGDVRRGLAAALSLRPDVVVVDVNLPDGSGLDAAKRLRAELPDLGIVVLTMYDDDEHLFAALEAQASAFVAKSAPTDEVLSAARHAAAAPHAFTAADLPGAMRRRMDPTKPRLSAREQDVLELLGEGLTIPVLAKRLYISESTAKTYASKLYEKLGASNRSQALVEAVRLGLLKVPAGGTGKR